MSTVSRKEGHILLAGVRVLEHLNGRSPTPEQLAELLAMDASSVRLQLNRLADLEVISLVQSAYETHVELRDHHRVDELPEEEENLDEAILYETYIKKSLDRKSEDLDDAALKITKKDRFSNLIEILEEVALRLQGSREDFFLLEEFVGTDKQNLAELLWKMSESDEKVDELVREKEKAVEDATARIGVRSLLTRIKTDNETHKWPVDFCHRSMREYFVAKGICSALREDMRRTKAER